MIYDKIYTENRVFISSPVDNTLTHTNACMLTICMLYGDADKDGKVLANETAPNHKQEI